MIADTVPTREQVAELLDPQGFRQWLERFDARAIVGRCALPGSCPIRNFLAEQGVPEPTVSGSTVDWEGFAPCAYRTMRLPEWSVAFIRGVDRLYPLSREQHPWVTALDCIGVLDGQPTRLVAA